VSPKRPTQRLATTPPKREPLVAPRMTDALTIVDDWDAGEALGWSEVDVRGEYVGVDAPQLDVTRSRFVDVRLTAGRFEGARFTDVRFEGCDLSGATLMESSFTRVEFVRCRLSGTTLGGSRCRDLRFVDCKLDGAHLRSMKGERLEMERCVATNVDFAAAQLTGCRLFDCDLGGADFSNVSLPGVRLHGSALDELRGAGSLRNAVIDTAQIVPLALRMFHAIGVTVDDDRDPEPDH